MVHKPLGTRRLFGKFMLLLLPVFAIATAAGLVVVSQLFIRNDQDLLNARIGNLTARVSSIIATESSGPDAKAPGPYLGILMADPAIRCAELRSADGKQIAASPHRIGCTGQESYERLDLALPDGSQTTLSIHYANDELASIRNDKRLFTQLALLVGLLVAALASWIGFRLYIGRPIGSLLEAIRKSAETGEATAVADPPDDELGAVIGAFNDMQAKLQAEAQRNLAALRRLDLLYNETPALMFSICPGSHFTSVSGHWLDTTGFRREEVVGKPLQDFLLPADGADQSGINTVAHEPLRDHPCLLRCKDGSTLNVLLSSIPSQRDDGGGNDFLCIMSDVSSLVAARQSLQTQMMTDPLTKLPNRRALFDYLGKIAKTDHKQLFHSAILFVDLDNFKWVNDTHGHAAGDTLLLAAAARIRNCVSAGDFLSRLGGDEFALVLNGYEGKCNPEQVAKRIIAQLSLPFQLGGVTAYVGCSIGIVDCDLDVNSSEELLRLADLAMYKSKQDGRNRATSYSAELGKRVLERDRMVNRIRTALHEQQFRLYCQPIIDLTTMQPAGAEVLLRLHCPVEGAMAPAAIVKTAEETGMMGQIGQWVVGEGFAMASRWQNAGDPLYLAINLSPRQLDTAFMAELIDRLRASPAIARKLVFEITESSLLTNPDRIVQFFADVRTAGARIALDDFGTGYSSLNYISRFPVDLVKLDRSFVRNIDDATSDTARRNLALVRSTATLCHALDIAVVAEGVETAGELEVLRDIGIRYCQGFLFSRPLPEASFGEWSALFCKRQTAPLALAEAIRA